MVLVSTTVKRHLKLDSTNLSTDSIIYFVHVNSIWKYELSTFQYLFRQSDLTTKDFKRFCPILSRIIVASFLSGYCNKIQIFCTVTVQPNAF